MMRFSLGLMLAGMVACASESRAQSEPESGFVSLFNGKDFTGWRTRPSEGRRWIVGNVSIHRKDPSRLGLVPPKPGETGDRVDCEIAADSGPELPMHVVQP